MIINDLDGYYIVFDTKNWNTELDTLTINVTLNEDKQSFDEVVVVGYGVQKKKLVTGATVQLKGDDIAKLNTTNPLSAMQGQTPGVNIVSTSGQPGAAMKGLAFSKSMETKFTVHSLFAVPQW